MNDPTETALESARATRRDFVKSGAVFTAFALPPLSTLGATEPPAPVRLSLNENPFGCSPAAMEAIRNGARNLNRYTEHEANALTAQIAAKEALAPEQVVLGDVLAPLGLQLSLAGGPGGEFLYSIPGFTDLTAAATQAGGNAIGIPLNGRLENDLSAFAARINARTRAVYLVNPHNPSGTVSDSATLKSFVRDMSRRTLVVLDEAYLEYTDDFSVRTLTPFVREGGNVVVFRTFGKIYGHAIAAAGCA